MHWLRQCMGTNCGRANVQLSRRGRQWRTWEDVGMKSAGSSHDSSSTDRRHRRTGRRACWLASVLLLQACTSDHSNGASSTSTSPDTAVTTTTGTGTGTGDGGGLGLQGVTALRLSEGHALAAPATPVPLVTGTPLDGAGVQAVVDRLPEWTTGDALSEVFRWPTETRPVPRAGATVDVAFPADAELPPAEVPTGQLHVLRFQPEGDVPIAPFATITFDQPMVPITTVGQLDDAAVPATITPAVPGHWQWIGTRTLRFDATSDELDRLPMATAYTVAIPAGTTSATGGVLAEAVSFQFSTPAVTVQSFEPTGPSQALTPVFVATFDQRVDADAVLATTEVRADDQRVEIRLATADEIAADAVAAQVTAQAQDARWIAFRPVVPFAPDTAIDISIGPGTPSAEGPKVTTAAASYSARTYAPLSITSVSCNYGGGCPPLSDIVIEFDNALDATLFDPATIGIDPTLAGASVGVSGNILTIHGATAGRTTYRVTVPADLTDVYGQRLGKAEERSIDIGPAAPILQQFSQPLTTVDPSAVHPSVTVVTVNHRDLRVRLFRVAPTDWNAYIQYFVNTMQRGPVDGPLPSPPWTPFFDDVVAVGDTPDRAVETTIDLTDALADGAATDRLGHVVVLVETTEQYPADGNDYWNNRPTVTWAQSTAIGLDAFADTSTLHAWTTKLVDGSPLSGVTVQAQAGDGSAAGPAATSDGDGLATIELSSTLGQYLLATAGDDTALLANGFYGGGWQRQAVADEPRWFVFDDRHTYRPGETVSLKGWIRRLTLSGDAQLQLVGPDATVAFTVTDGQGSPIADGTADVGPLGGFDLTFTIPADSNLGYSFVQLTLGGVAGLSYGGTSHQFQIQEFRRPQFEVQARSESPDPAVLGTPTTVAVDANYYAGGPLGAAPVDWQVTTSAATYAPPGWDDYTFGRWTPWWYATDDFGYAGGYADSIGGYSTGPCCGPPDQSTATFTGETDAGGSHYLQIDVAGLDPSLAGLPVAVSAQATVTDVNRQQLADTTALIVHPGELYVGLRGAQTFVDRGEPLRVEAIVTDIDGAVVTGRAVRMTASRTDSVFRNGAWTTEQLDPQSCDITSAAEAVACTFTTAVGGMYTVTATVTDDHNRTSMSELTRWVSGAVTPPTRTVAEQTLTIVPDSEVYTPGGTAHLLVQSPFATGTGLLTVTRNGIIATLRFDVTDGSAVVDVPITDAEIAGIDVSIEVVGATERTSDDGTPAPDAPLRPAFATGAISLPISTASRTLTVSAVPHETSVEPGASTQVDVSVADAAGRPVAGSELAVVVVDEAVLALSGGQGTGDPLGAFYGGLPSYISAQYGRSSIVLSAADAFGDNGSSAGASADTTAATDASPETTAAGSADDSKTSATLPATGPSLAGGGAGYDNGTPTATIAVRTSFDALAVFEPSVLTDDAGHATVDVPLPDSLTRYRVMVVAVAGAQQFGSTEATITARLPLMVRPTAPRFLNFGDTFELPVVVQNQTDADMQVDVVVQADNLSLGEGADAATGVGQRVTVPANDRIEVRFAMAAATAGTGRFRVAATSGDAADAATVELPVYTPATAEAFATYGVIDDGATLQPVVAPTGVIPGFGGLDITTSSTSLQALTDAVIYLTQYPYQSADALASRIVAIAALRPVLDAFDAPGLPSSQALDGAVADDITALVALQNDDGGFPFWLHGEMTDPFISVQAAQALVVARDAGYTVPGDSIARALAHLTEIEQTYPGTYSQETRDIISAAALHVRALGGDRDAAKANDLYDRRADALSLDALAWLWPVVDDPAAIDGIDRKIQNAAVDTAGAVTFTTAASDEAYLTLQSDRRTDGIILDALIVMQPQSDLVPKVVAGLLAGQTQGRWDNVQENSYILLALKRYFDAYESQTPEFVATVWLGDRFAGEHAFSGRSTDRARLTIPTADVIVAGDADLTISREPGSGGSVAGRLYYRIGLRTAPADLQLSPLDRGFTVTREYSAIDDPADVTRDADGTWHIKAGARVRVRLTMVAESQRTHVALVDPLPAGLEVLNPVLATTPNVPTDDGSVDSSVARPDTWWWGTWFDHQNLRDDRAEAFATYLPAGVYDYTYVATATTPGTFVVPPTRAEEMYAPETFGRASTERVVVEG